MTEPPHDPSSAAPTPIDTGDDAPGASVAPVELVLDASGLIGFAAQQFGATLVRSLAIKNVADGELRDVAVQARLANGVAQAWSARIDSIAPGATHTLAPVDMRLAPEPLARQTERERTELIVTSAVEGFALVERRSPVDVLAADEWPGARSRPELLASFVLPNHPAIEPVLVRSGELLAEATGQPGLDGYQSGDTARARRMAEAAYVALLERGIGYINPPASFEREGQRVRLADRVLESRLGTCLDLSLLLAGVWEQAGLHPILVLLPEHAFVGAWTRKEHFADAVLDSGLTVRKRAELGEIVLVESTLLTHGDRGTFGDACQRAFDRLASEARPVHVIDVRAARRLGVRPLPMRVERGSASEVAGDTDGDGTGADPVRYTLAPEGGEPLTPAFDVDGSAEETPAPAFVDGDRLSRWKRRLLDLSLRNRLINFRTTRRTVPLLVGDAAALEDRLAAGGRLELHARPEPRADGAASAAATDTRAYLLDELRAGRLRADLSEAENQRRGTELFRDARGALEESGANLLHLAIGTLVWRESADADPREAPLVLLPLTLERPGGGRPLRVSLSDEPARPNAALLEKLRVDFAIHDSSLHELPEDDRGVDIAEVLRRYREAVKRIDGWEVRETACLGLFGFSRFLMWRDLEARSEDLKRSELVRRLLDDPDAPVSLDTHVGIDDEPARSEPNGDGDTEHPPGEPLLTRDADASQVAAVDAASRGETFVLQGPPGTGKSQTIANMIADALGRGERVLFVAEKRAALSVVRRRLEQDGLGPFCLELHSNRASKREVLDQLREALDAGAAAEPGGWDAACRKLAESRDRLNRFVRELNTPQASGESVREVIDRLSRIGDGPVVRLAMGESDAIDAERLSECRAAVGGLARAARSTAGERSDVSTHPLRGIGVRAFSFSLPDAARHAIDALASAAAELSTECDRWIESVGVASCGLPSADEIAWRVDTAELLARCPGTTEELLAGRDWTALRDELAAWVERGRERDRLRKSLLARYDRAFFDLDLPALAVQAARANAASGVKRWWGMRPVRAALKAVCLDAAPDAAQAVRDLDGARRALELDESLAGAAVADRAFGHRWSADNADWALLSTMLEWADAVRRLLAVPGPRHAAAGVADRVIEAAVADAGREGDHAACLRARFDAFGAARKSIDKLLNVDASVAWGTPDAPAALARVDETLARWRDALPDLNEWCAWTAAAADAEDAGLGQLAAGLRDGGLDIDDAPDVFERSFGSRWLTATADRLDSIRGFSGRSHNQAIRRFAELDSELLALTRALVRARLAASVPPAAADPSPKSEIGVLRRQLELKRRHMPIRQLVERIPGTLARLKPCFLMSPLSIAQYLDPALPPFDLVVFDEASQIPPWEAIGAIARGSRVVVVGDTKQLPPTSFFEKAEPDDDDTVSEAAELESILQECVASGVPTRRLLWHYRSRHDSLIAFSNEQYYGNRLQTFPAPAEPGGDLGISLRRVDGVYDRGGTRTNRVEAEAVVDELARVLLHEVVTVGVVCFNLAQQVLIEDLLDERCRREPALEAARQRFESLNTEPVFVKNLESVQGDERDVILFSITYGPDDDGRMPLNFGPLNRDGGERRLNVVVTRARRRVVAFASFDPEGIDPDRTDAVGVRHLRRFLERARTPVGPALDGTALAAADLGAIESAVRDELTARGHDVAVNVGSGPSRVALAVRDPADPTRFVLGIEFDGPGYADVRSARDRDRIRPAVMAGLGWRLHRVWSPEWHLNREGVLRSVERAVTEAARAARRIEAPPSIGSGPEARSATADTPNDPPGETPQPRTVPADPIGLASAAAAEPEPTTPSPTPYAAWLPTTLVGDRETLMDQRRTAPARDALIEIVTAEAPITRSLATRRLAEAFGVERLIRSVRDRCEVVIEDAVKRNRIAQHDDALWPAKADPTLDAPRTPGDTDGSKRALEHIPLAERVAAVRWVLREQIALPDDELTRHAARLLGTQRLTERTDPLMREAINAHNARPIEGPGDAAGRSQDEADDTQP